MGFSTVVPWSQQLNRTTHWFAIQIHVDLEDKTYYENAISDKEVSPSEIQSKFWMKILFYRLYYSAETYVVIAIFILITKKNCLELLMQQPINSPIVPEIYSS